MTPEMLLARVSGQSIALAEPIGGARPEWTMVEAGWGMAGLPERYSVAFRYRHGRDGTVFARLRRYLRLEAERLAWREKWKRKCAGREYLDEIVTWALLEEWLSLLDRQRLLTLLLGAWPEGAYERELSEKQRALGMILDRWNSIAHEHVARRIREQETDLDEPLLDIA